MRKSNKLFARRAHIQSSEGWGSGSARHQRSTRARRAHEVIMSKALQIASNPLLLALVARLPRI